MFHQYFGNAQFMISTKWGRYEKALELVLPLTDSAQYICVKEAERKSYTASRVCKHSGHEVMLI